MFTRTGYKTKIVAEIGANHNQDYKTAVQLIKAAKDIGADAVKVQVFNPEQMAYPGRGKMEDGPWEGMTLYELYRNIAMPKYWLPDLMDMANHIGIPLFPSVFHPDTVYFTEACKVPVYKIASFEATDLNLIKSVAKTMKPIIISTGKATCKDIDKAVKTVKKYHDKIVLLKCVSEYPAKIEDYNLMTIPAMKHNFKVEVGLSDHSKGIMLAPLAVAMGARMIEKHITLDGTGYDAGFSLTPEEFSAMVNLVRTAEKAVGDIKYAEPDRKYCRSLIATKKIKVGEEYTGKVELLRTLEKGVMSIDGKSDREYKPGELIKEKKNVAREKHTNNRRNGKPREKASRKNRERT